MKEMVEWGKIAHGFYRTATRLASPLIYGHIRYRILRGLDHPTRWPERLGRPSSRRPLGPLGPLLWFHAVSLGFSLPKTLNLSSQVTNGVILG